MKITDNYSPPMDLLTKTKLKTDLVGIKTRLKMDRAYDAAIAELNTVKRKLEMKNVETKLKMQRARIKYKIDQAFIRLREKSVDAVEYIEGIIDALEEKKGNK